MHPNLLHDQRWLTGFETMFYRIWKEKYNPENAKKKK